MVKYSKVNVKLSDTQLKKLKAAVKDKTGITLRISLKMFDGNDLPHELLLTTRQKTKLRNAFNNNMSTDLTIPLAKNVLAPLGITAAASAIDAGIQKKQQHGSGTRTSIISNEEMNDMIKIVQALEDSNILLKGITKTIKNETKDQKGGFLSILLGTLGAILL